MNPVQVHHLPMVINYSGDLSVEVRNNDRTEIDPQSETIKWYFDVIVKNRNGNIPFTFNVAFKLNREAISFHSNSNRNGKIRVVELDVNESRTYIGYIVTGIFSPDPEARSITLTATIEEASPSETEPFIYKITNERNRANNTDEISRSIPYFPALEPFFENLSIEDLPLVDFAPGSICGYAAQGWSASRMWLWAVWFPEQTNLVTCDLGELRLIPEIAGSFRETGKHFFHIKTLQRGGGYKYLIPGDLGIDYCKMVDARPDNELLRRWVFTIAPVPPLGYMKYNVFNVALGPKFALHCTSVADDDFNLPEDGSNFSNYLF
ncbi:MAG: hypothetical protein ACXWCT_14765, partial [Flavitalea sp.]